MAISDKLNYLIETKQLFKDRLNSLGAEITSSTTFRNYLTWLDTFYNNVSDKTDLSVSGVVGRTSQDSTTGANLMPIVNVTKTVNGITLTNNGNGTITLNGTATAQVLYPITNTGNSTLRRIPVTENNYKFMLYGDTNVSNDTYFLQVLFGTETETTKFFGATDNGATSLHIATDRSIGYALVIRKGQSFNNHIIKPMGVLSTYTGGFEPFTNGASPNPNYPQPINNLTGNVSYNVVGAQLYDYTDLMSSYDFLTYDEDGWYTITYTNPSSTNGKYLNFTTPVSNLLETDTDYTIVTEVKSLEYTGGGVLAPVDRWGQFQTATNYAFNNISNNTTYTVVKTTKSDFSNVTGGCLTSFVYCQASSSVTIKFRLSIIKDTSVTPSNFNYEPYIEPQTFNIPLGDIELCKIDTYEDKIYSSNGRFYLNKNIGNHLFTTSDNISKGGSSTDGYARCGWGLTSEIATSDFTKALVICNKFLGVPQNDNTTSTTGQHWYCSVSNTDNFKIMFRCGDAEYTRDTFPEFIKNNEIIVYYPLKEPTTTEITEENYPSLYNALKQIQDYLTAYKINKEFILGYSSPEIEY